MNISEMQLLALLKMFKAVPRCGYGVNNTVSAQDAAKMGVVFVDDSGKCFTNVTCDVIDAAVELYGYDGTWSYTFHTFKETERSSYWALITNQIAHYMDTYGREAAGLEPIHNIPIEKMNLPMQVPYKAMTCIWVTSENNIHEMVTGWLCNAKNLNTEQVDMANLFIDWVTSPDLIKSFEVKCLWYKKTGMVPADPAEYLRYTCYRATGKPLLVKNPDTIHQVSMYVNSHLSEVEDELRHLSWKRCAESFYRFKPIWLAFKKTTVLRHAINVIRRLAVSEHKPMDDRTVQNFSNLVKNWERSAADTVLQKANLRDLVKLYNYCSSELEAE